VNRHDESGVKNAKQSDTKSAKCEFVANRAAHGAPVDFFLPGIVALLVGSVGRKSGGNHVRRRRGNGAGFTTENGEFGESMGYFAAKVEIEARTIGTEQLLGLAVMSELNVIGNLGRCDRTKEQVGKNGDRKESKSPESH
jgi:hypothetical protein